MSESGSGTIGAWSVEARCSLDTHVTCNGVILGSKWQRLHFPKEAKGVPPGPAWHQPWLSLTGRYAYESAQALRWWWLAVAEAERCLGSIGVETRLVREKITYSYGVSRHASGHVENEDTRRWVSKLEGESDDPSEPPA